MSPARLIEVATQLTLSSDDTPRRQERLRRAVSTAYHAIFHALANSNADTLYTRRQNGYTWPQRRQTEPVAGKRNKDGHPI